MVRGFQYELDVLGTLLHPLQGLLLCLGQLLRGGVPHGVTLVGHQDRCLDLAGGLSTGPAPITADFLDRVWAKSII